MIVYSLILQPLLDPVSFLVCKELTALVLEFLYSFIPIILSLDLYKIDQTEFLKA